MKDIEESMLDNYDSYEDYGDYKTKTTDFQDSHDFQDTEETIKKYKKEKKEDTGGYEIDKFANILVEHRPNTKKFKHNYTSELELKSLLIRIKNDRGDKIDSKRLNKRINKYIRWHTAINEKKYDDITKRKNLKKKLKDRIVRDSELTAIDTKTFERFGFVILLMVKNILTKPQFSGYTYRDDFYSDAVYKILKYLGNFNHNLISKRTGTPVNSFAYISQIIHNSVLHIIIKKGKENENLKNRVAVENLSHNMYMNNNELIEGSFYNKAELVDNVLKITLDKVDVSLKMELESIQDKISDDYRIELIYPYTYSISFEEYADMKELLNGKISVIRNKPEDSEQTEG